MRNEAYIPDSQRLYMRIERHLSMVGFSLIAFYFFLLLIIAFLWILTIQVNRQQKRDVQPPPGFTHQVNQPGYKQNREALKQPGLGYLLWIEAAETVIRISDGCYFRVFLLQSRPFESRQSDFAVYAFTAVSDCLFSFTPGLFDVAVTVVLPASYSVTQAFVKQFRCNNRYDEPLQGDSTAGIIGSS